MDDFVARHDMDDPADIVTIPNCSSIDVDITPGVPDVILPLVETSSGGGGGTCQSILRHDDRPTDHHPHPLPRNDPVSSIVDATYSSSPPPFADESVPAPLATRVAGVAFLLFAGPADHLG